MSTESIQNTSFGWQFRQLGQRLSEWIELQLYGPDVPNSPPPPEFSFPEWLGTLLVWFSILLSVLGLSWLIFVTLKHFLDNRTPRLPKATLTKLPEPEPERSVGDWLRQAKSFEQAGNWQEACRALYLAALQKLHDRKWIPQLASRTDGEYLQQLTVVTQQRPYQLLIRTHERSHFGTAILTAENLRHCQQAYQEIEKR